MSDCTDCKKFGNECNGDFASAGRLGCHKDKKCQQDSASNSTGVLVSYFAKVDEYVEASERSGCSTDAIYSKRKDKAAALKEMNKFRKLLEETTRN